MQTLTKLAPTKMFMSGRESGPISQINLRAPFGGDTNILEYVQMNFKHREKLYLSRLAA